MAGSILEKMCACASLFENAGSYVLIGHQRADGDAIGTMAALYYRLVSQGRTVTPFLFEEIPRRYEFLGFQEHVTLFDSASAEHAALVQGADVVVILDASSDDRLPGWQPLLAARRGSLVRFDHHPSSVPGGADIDMTDTSACATGQIVLEFMKLDGIGFSPEEAQALFVAIATDTGWFRYSNTNRAAFRQVSDLLDCGVAPAEIFRSIYQCNELPLIRLAGRVVSTIEEEMDGRLLWGTIDRALVEETGLKNDFETDILMDLLRSSRKAVCVALFREGEDGRVRVNLRSKGDVAVNGVAEMFGGGGHRNAAGATLDDANLDEAAGNVVDALRHVLVETKKRK
jgi:bifunctional oligoribonuclease and PAP phosphatase NrnA